MTHIPVLLQEVVKGLSLKPGAVFFDGTLGGGGHSKAVAESLGGQVTVFGTDMDDEAVKRAEKALAETGAKTNLYVSNFRGIDECAQDAEIELIDGALLDLGLSSYQLDEVPRGFSFRRDEPLLMTMKRDPNEGDVTAEDIVNTWSEETIADIIYAYGEERYARRIARAIVTARSTGHIESTGQLVKIIEESVPAVYRRGRIHPATRTFQALRIAVNEELESLKQGLEKIFTKLSPSGRLAVITFHSLEDRIVKHWMREKVLEGLGNAVTRKPIIPHDEEIKSNPRSRSAKLRIIEKI